jgi:adenylate kinase family enzyme
MTLKRAMVIGCCGAGKSTFSKALHAVTQLELIHLDQHYWKPDWEETDSEQWSATVQELADRPNWIIDGNYGGTMDLRIRRADTIIYLDYPAWRCLWRVVKRVIKYRGRVRPDMPGGCRERFDWEFLHYVAVFNWRKRGPLMQKLKAVKREKRVEILRSDQEVARFLEGGNHKKNNAAYNENNTNDN